MLEIRRRADNGDDLDLLKEKIVRVYMLGYR